MHNINAYEYLQEHQIKPSHQRLAVMDYLLKNRTHPTVDEIHGALAPTMPTLSKTTVYNTLKVLVDQGAARMLTISERFTNFDADTSTHGHFLCTCCGKVSDICIDEKKLKRSHCLPEGYTPITADLYFRGICPECDKQ